LLSLFFYSATIKRGNFPPKKRISEILYCIKGNSQHKFRPQQAIKMWEQW
jgi:hypothetical protein